MNKKEKLDKKIQILNSMLKNNKNFIEEMKKEQEKNQDVLNPYLNTNKNKKLK